MNIKSSGNNKTSGQAAAAHQGMEISSESIAVVDSAPSDIRSENNSIFKQYSELDDLPDVGFQSSFESLNDPYLDTVKTVSTNNSKTMSDVPPSGGENSFNDQYFHSDELFPSEPLEGMLVVDENTLPKKRNIGDLIGDYLIVANIGEGGFGHVYHACHVNRDKEGYAGPKDVAIKVVRTNDRNAYDVDEVKALSKANGHENVLPMYDAFMIDGPEDGTEGPECAIVCQFVTGETLLDVITRVKYLEEKDAVRFSRQICRALVYLNSQGIAHGDLKPTNVMVQRSRVSCRPQEGKAKLIDFGLSFTWDADQPEPPMRKSLCGTTNYIAPEALGMNIHDPAHADVYSLGVVMYEMVTGKVTEYLDHDTRFMEFQWCKISLGFTKIIYDCLLEVNERPTTRDVLARLDALS